VINVAVKDKSRLLLLWKCRCWHACTRGFRWKL